MAPLVREPGVNHEWKLQLHMIFRCLLFFISIRGQQRAVDRVPAREDSTALWATFRVVGSGWL